MFFCHISVSQIIPSIDIKTLEGKTINKSDITEEKGNYVNNSIEVSEQDGNLKIVNGVINVDKIKIGSNELKNKSKL